MSSETESHPVYPGESRQVAPVSELVFSILSRGFELLVLLLPAALVATTLGVVGQDVTGLVIYPIVLALVLSTTYEILA